MKLKLEATISIKGYSKLFGVHHTKITARDKEINTNCTSDTINKIINIEGSHTKEYRLIKENGQYCFRDTIMDLGINGSHKTIKEAIGTALKYVDIHIDEPLNYSSYPIFRKLDAQHKLRTTGKCKHININNYHNCQECGLNFHPDNK